MREGAWARGGGQGRWTGSVEGAVEEGGEALFDVVSMLFGQIELGEGGDKMAGGRLGIGALEHGGEALGVSGLGIDDGAVVAGDEVGAVFAPGAETTGPTGAGHAKVLTVAPGGDVIGLGLGALHEEGDRCHGAAEARAAGRDGSILFGRGWLVVERWRRAGFRIVAGPILCRNSWRLRIGQKQGVE